MNVVPPLASQTLRCLLHDEPGTPVRPWLSLCELEHDCVLSGRTESKEGFREDAAHPAYYISRGSLVPL